MLVFKPLDDTRARAAFEARGILYDAGCYAFYADAGDGEAGYCLCRVQGMDAQLLSLDLTQEEPALAQGLVRAVLNCAANHGAYTARCSMPGYFAFLTGMGFQNNGASVSGEIPEILTGACHNFGKI